LASDNDDDGTIWVTSTRGGPDPACELTWGTQRWHAPVADIRSTAIDLVTCAAYAEMMMQLAVKLKLPAQTAAGFTTDLLATSGRTRFGTPATLDLLPAGSTKRGEAVVLLRRGPMAEWEGVVSPAAAREMAGAWFAAAEATESDRLVVRALEEFPSADPALTERLFTRLRQLRDDA
jgi:hypothetical protein